MKTKQIKLSAAQQRVVGLLSEGWVYGYNADVLYLWDGMHKKGTKNVPYIVARKLYELGVIDSNHKLTQFGKTFIQS